MYGHTSFPSFTFLYLETPIHVYSFFPPIVHLFPQVF